MTSSSPKKRAPKGSVKGLHPCPTCQKIYNNDTGKKRFCSKDCYPVHERPCVVCNTIFKARKKSQSYCSVECTKQAAAQKEQATKNKEGLVECLVCNSYFKQLQTHLNSKHKLTSLAYLKLYPLALITSHTTSRLISARVAGENNPWFNHQGALSPFSKNNKKLNGLTEVEKEVVIRQNIDAYVRSTPPDQRPMNLSYWVKRGYPEAEAIKLRKNRQSTFSKEKCVTRLGEVAGLKRWNERQHLWLSNYTRSNYSKVSQELFRLVLAADPVLLEDALFANRFSDNENAEITLRAPTMSIKLDFCSRSLMKVIEFDGDYWHSPERVNDGHELKRDAALELLGFDVLHVKEHEYRNSKQGAVLKCLHFLKV